MNETPPACASVVGLEPWLPWPLSASKWWTQPVRAERLAALRIAAALCLLIDILASYRPSLDEFFGSGGLGGARLFAYYGEAPKLYWSLLRGPGDPLLAALALTAWVVLTGWLAVDGRAWYTRGSGPQGWRCRVLAWLGCAAWVALGAWARASDDRSAWLWSWQESPSWLAAALWAWIASACLLLAGLWTRWAALLTWVMTMSFANVNPNIDNAGDTIRGIILFYLMLCPGGAVWSIDAFRRAPSTPVHVPPWPLRLLFVQLVLIYFMNGLYKVTSFDWLRGDSLHYVLGDLSLTRLSRTQVPIPLLLTRLATWMVLAWELAFPVLVFFRQTRKAALLFGVLFHLGIFVTMELGGFVPYVLCLYVPLLPWENFPVRGNRDCAPTPGVRSTSPPGLDPDPRGRNDE